MKEYTRSQRKEIAEAFKSAKKHLWDGENPSKRPRYDNKLSSYICHAIEYADYSPSHDPIEVIESRLGYDNTTVRDYLEFVLKVPVVQLTTKNVQEFRHRWLDALIEEFSN